MAILVTGGTGFLGSYLIRHLVLEKGLTDVVVLDRFPAPERIAEVIDRVTLVQADILEPQELFATISRHSVDRIAHLAFLPGAANAEKIVPYLKTQITGTCNVFEAARLSGITRVVTASSVAVYGRDRAGPLTEDRDQTNPADWYGVCKQMVEQMARLYNEQHGMEIVSFRICASLGHGRLARASLRSGLTSERAGVHLMAYPELALRGETVTMPQDDQLIDVLYAADTAEAWWLALEAGHLDHYIFNLRGEQRRAGAMTEHLRLRLPQADIRVSETPVALGTLMDNTRLIAELGFKPRYTLETGIDDYLDRVRRASR